MSYTQNAVVVVVPGDLHLTEPGLENHRDALRVVEEVNGLVRPDFVQFIGDNVQDATPAQFALFDEVRRGLSVPDFSLVGDHDVKGDPTASGFRRHVGEPYGASTLRGFHFVRLDTQEARPLGLSDEQTAWFRGEIDGALARGERVVVFQHNYPFQVWEDFDGPGVDAWRALVQTRRVEAIVCGHTHYWQVANDGRNVYVAARSIGDPEGGPTGYAVLYLRGDDLAVAFRPVGRPEPLVLVTHPRDRLLATGPRHVIKGADRVEARVWSESPVDRVEARVDGGPWAPLEPNGAGSWAGPFPGDRLPKGEHAVEVRASAGGREGRGEVAAVVDPTGRYTPAPETRPVVKGTAFC